MLCRIVSLAGVVSFAMGASAQNQPQVAFIGDNLTYEWQQQPQFQAHKNWLPYGFTTIEPGGAGSSTALSELKAIIASGRKPMIHLLAGQADADALSPGNNPALILAKFATNLENIITTARAANLKIIVGTVPYAFTGDVAPLNEWIFLYCNAHNVPVINYAFALNSGAGFAASRGSGAAPPAYYNQAVSSGGREYSLTSAGYDLITDMAETQIGLTAGTFRLTRGFLQDVTLEDYEDAPSSPNNNSVIDGSIIQFTPYGEFSDGATRIINNADQYGHVGAWTSSSPDVVLLDQLGVGTSFRKGSSNIHFVSNSGVAFNEWTMYVSVYELGLGLYGDY